MKSTHVIVRPFQPDPVLFPAGVMDLTAMRAVLIALPIWGYLRRMETRGRKVGGKNKNKTN